MEKIIGITNVRTKIKDIVDKVSDKEETYIVTRDSKPEAVIMSYDKYLKNKELILQGRKIRLEKLLVETRRQFNEWLKKKGYDVNKLSEEEVERIIENA